MKTGDLLARVLGLYIQDIANNKCKELLRRDNTSLIMIKLFLFSCRLRIFLPDERRPRKFLHVKHCIFNVMQSASFIGTIIPFKPFHH